MSLEHLISSWISAWYLGAGYFGILLAMAIESCCIPLPSEIVMPLAGAYVVLYPERFSLIGVTLAGTIGCVVGSAAAYWIGRTGGRPLLLRYGRYILISQADSDRADRLFSRHGNGVTFFSRLLPVIRTYISLPAGIAQMNFTRFTLYTFLGSLPWCLLLAFVGTKIGERTQQIGELTRVFHGLDIVIGIVIVAAIAFYVYRHIKHDNAARATDASDSPSGGATTSDTARANGGVPSQRRPHAIPPSPLETPDRPTVPDLNSIGPWPNRYARPAEPVAEAVDEPATSD